MCSSHVHQENRGEVCGGWGCWHSWHSEVVPGVHGHNFNLLKRNYIYKDDWEPAGDDGEAMDWEDRPEITHLFGSVSKDMMGGGAGGRHLSPLAYQYCWWNGEFRQLKSSKREIDGKRCHHTSLRNSTDLKRMFKCDVTSSWPWKCSSVTSWWENGRRGKTLEPAAFSCLELLSDWEPPPWTWKWWSLSQLFLTQLRTVQCKLKVSVWSQEDHTIWKKQDQKP